MPDLDEAGARAYYKEIHYMNADADGDLNRVEIIQFINLMRKGRWRNQLAEVVGHRGDYDIETNRASQWASTRPRSSCAPTSLRLCSRQRTKSTRASCSHITA
jgi:hypothetical protein